MNRAESLIATARAAGIDVCFANPGTSEMALVAALVCANRAYRILQIELQRAGMPRTGRAARSLTDLGEPGPHLIEAVLA